MRQPSAKIALIHSALHPVAATSEAFPRLWPEAQVQNILDDGLYSAIATGAGLDDLKERFRALLRYAINCGADAALFTSSAFGTCLESAIVDASIPVFTPNGALIEDIVSFPGPVALIATFESTLQSILPGIPKDIGVIPHFVRGALTAYEQGDLAMHDKLVVEAAETILECKAFAFAQFSLARVAIPVGRATGRPVMTSLECAILKAKRHFYQGAQ